MATADFTEAALEAGIAQAIKYAFPFLSYGAVKHQLVFNVTLGHKTIAVDGIKALKAFGRCDILLEMDGKPLAILELTRPGLALTDADRVQGMSYAKLTEPWSPLVVVTNGEDTQLYSTFTGEEWKPKTQSEEAFAEIMASTAKIAEDDIRQAIKTIIGPQSTVWLELVRSITRTSIKDLTGPAHTPLSPFTKDIFFPRTASESIFGCISEGTRCVIVTGGPLSGKSNVLLGFVLDVDSREDTAALFIDSSSATHGVLQTLANAMTGEFGWGVTKDDIRSWLIHISNADDGPHLVLVIDGSDVLAIQSELGELVSEFIGPRLQLVLAVDNVAVEKLTRNAKGSQLTRIGKVSKMIEVDTLDDKEFALALKVLYDQRICFIHGAHRAPEYRRPWVLRWIAADSKSAKEYQDETAQAAIPSMMGLTLLWATRNRFASNPKLVGKYTTLAEAVLEDIEAPERSVAFSLASIASPIARLETVRSHLGEAEFGTLIEHGYLKHAMLDHNERIVVALLPELLMTTLPLVLSQKLRGELREGIEHAAEKLIFRCGRLFAGDVIGAQAIVDVATKEAGLPISFLTELLKKPPLQKEFLPGSRMTGFVAEDIRADFLVLSDGKIQVTGPGGERFVIDHEVDEQLYITDVTSWQILSHMAALPSAVQSHEDGSVIGRLDPAILLEVGSCLQPIRPTVASGFDEVRQHDVPGGSVVCHREGIIEPITNALMRSMLGDRESAEQVIEEALARQNMPLLLRLHIALSQVSKMGGSENSVWAKSVLQNRIQSALSESGLLH